MPKTQAQLEAQATRIAERILKKPPSDVAGLLRRTQKSAFLRKWLARACKQVVERETARFPVGARVITPRGIGRVSSPGPKETEVLVEYGHKIYFANDSLVLMDLLTEMILPGHYPGEGHEVVMPFTTEEGQLYFREGRVYKVDDASWILGGPACLVRWKDQKESDRGVSHYPIQDVFGLW